MRERVERVKGLWRSAVGALLLACACSCRAVVNFDEPPDARTSAQSQANALLPFLPAAELKESCEQCAEERCGTLHSLCLEDGVCRELLACNARCDQPVCFAKCGSFAEFGGAAAGSAGFPIGPENLRYYEYKTCISSLNCRDACGVGVNWGCLRNDRYRWLKSYSGALPVQLSVIDERTLSAMSARVEARTSGDGFVARGDTGEWGQVELDLNSRDTFDGFFTVSPKIAGYGSVLYYPGVLFRGSRGATGVVHVSNVAPEVAHQVSVAFTIHDCLGALASGVSFEVDGQSAQSTWAVTTRGGTTPGQTLTTEYGTAGLNGLTPQRDPVIVHAFRRGQEVAQRSVFLREGFATRADLWPLNGDD